MKRIRLPALAGLLVAVAAVGLSPAQNAGDWGTIKGQIKLTAAPEPKKVDVTVDKEHCLSKGTLVYTDIIVDPKSKGVKNIVLWLRPDDTNLRATFPKEKIHPNLAKAPAKHHLIDQPCCQFEPRVLAAREGDTLEVKNTAPVPHNVNYSSDDDAFNITIPSGKSFKLSKPLAAQRTPIPFKCDIHPWMAGRIRVFDHPYFAVTDANGNFEIKDAPAGKWRLVIWHENGYHMGREGAPGMPVEVKGGGTLEIPPIELELPKAN
jgi:plastocyanin